MVQKRRIPGRSSLRWKVKCVGGQWPYRGQLAVNTTGFGKGVERSPLVNGETSPPIDPLDDVNGAESDGCEKALNSSVRSNR